MIEPSVTYGNLYLDITREFAAQFKAGLPTPTPTNTRTATPTRTSTPTPTEITQPSLESLGLSHETQAMLERQGWEIACSATSGSPWSACACNPASWIAFSPSVSACCIISP